MKTSLFAPIALLAILLAACAPAPQPPLEPGPLGDGVQIDRAELLIMESYPVQVALVIEGHLPTPCHHFAYRQEIQDFGETIRMDITAYSQAGSDEACVQVLEPFEERIGFDLTFGPEGLFEVYLNGELVGEFSYPG